MCARRAKRIYERQVAPILAAAGLDVVVVETVQRGHAGKLAAALDLRQCDLLVLVGGDGTVFDALQVLFLARQSAGFEMFGARRSAGVTWFVRQLVLAQQRGRMCSQGLLQPVHISYVLHPPSCNPHRLAAARMLQLVHPLLVFNCAWATRLSVVGARRGVSVRWLPIAMQCSDSVTVWCVW